MGKRYLVADDEHPLTACDWPTREQAERVLLELKKIARPDQVGKLVVRESTAKERKRFKKDIAGLVVLPKAH
jgi:hypothetical protein